MAISSRRRRSVPTPATSLFRCLVDKVVLRRAGDRVHTRLVWRGGDSTSGDIRVTGGSFSRLSGADEMEATVLRLAKAGQTDRQIAAHLTDAGCRSPKSRTLLRSTVASVRLKHGQPRHPNLAHPHVIPGHSARENVPPAWDSPPEEVQTIRPSEVVYTTRLGGLLKHYERRVA